MTLTAQKSAQELGEEMLKQTSIGLHSKTPEILTLVANGALVDTRSGENGGTALGYAAWYGMQEVAFALIDNGASIELKGKSGLTPLMWAAMGGHQTIAEKLLKHGADSDAVCLEGFTAAEQAEKRGHSDLAEIIRTYHQKARDHQRWLNEGAPLREKTALIKPIRLKKPL